MIFVGNNNMKIKPNYGIDAPAVIKHLIIFGIMLPLCYLVLFYYLAQSYSNPLFVTFGYFAAGSTAISLWVTAGMMFITSKFSKERQAQRLLRTIQWNGNEYVLDAGCGRGLLAIQVAKYFSKNGHVVGVDIWNQQDLSNNSVQETVKNTQIEGVADRVDIQTGNICDLSYDDGVFDVVVSSFVVHNVSEYEDRMIALSEMMRVLKPGGYLLVQDIFYTQEYFNFFSDSQDVRQVELSGLQWGMFPPPRILMVQKI